jgi:hypothetical protein
MKSLLELLAKILNSFPKTDFILVHWCHVYRRYGLTPPNLVGTHISAPSVSSTDPATNIESTTATASGNITATGGENATTRGVCYVEGTGTPELTDTVNSESGSFGTGAFSRNLTGLSAGTTYTFRAFATNSAGTGFGANVQFTTGGVFTLTADAGSFTLTGQSATLTYTPNVSPTVALNTPADTATGISTTPTLEFTGTDPGDDDVRYNVQVDTVNTFDSQVDTTVIDSASGTGSLNPTISSTVTIYYAQAFTHNGDPISQVKFPARKTGSPTGIMTAEFFDIDSGTYGTNAKPADNPTPLASSTNSIDITTITAGVFDDPQEIVFTFDNDVVSSGEYFVALKVAHSSSDNSNKILGTTATHDGNRAVSVDGGSNWSISSGDLSFEVLTGSSLPLLNKVSGTDAGFANTVTGGDTDPFNSGEKADYDVQAGDELDASTEYFWRVRAIDPSGSNTYGDWSATRSFTTEAAGGAFTLTAEAGSFTLSGQSATFGLTRKLTADVGSFTLSGQNALLTKSYLDLVAEAGSFALSGQDATFGVTRKLTADAGAFTLTGQSATLNKTYLDLVADAGSFILSGQDAVLTYDEGGEEGETIRPIVTRTLIYPDRPFVSGRLPAERTIVF